MERVSKLLEDVAPKGADGVSQTSVEKSVAGTTTRVREAAAELVARGYARRWSGPRNSLLYASLRPYRETESVTDFTPSTTPSDPVGPRRDAVPGSSRTPSSVGSRRSRALHDGVADGDDRRSGEEPTLDGLE